MSAAEGKHAPLAVVWGEDDFSVHRRARGIFEEWVPGGLESARAGGAEEGDVEIIDAAAANTDEALRALRRVREALQTLPFFGSNKTIWFRGCNFAGEDRVSDGAAVVQSLSDLGRELSAFDWRGVRLVISAGKLDRRRTFFKALEKIADGGKAVIEHFPGLSAEDRDWRDKAGSLVTAEFRSWRKRPVGEALERFVDFVGPQPRQLAMEAQKVSTYVGDRPDITTVDVEAIVSRGRHARAFALADAVGDRHLGRALRHLEEEMWAMQSDRQKSEIGLLYGLVSKMRALLLAREMLAEGLIRATSDYRSFVGQMKRLPAGRFPEDRRYNPLEINAYVMFRAAQQALNFSTNELVDAMEELLRCNSGLVGSGLDGGLVLQMAITRIIGSGPPSRTSRPA